MAGCGAMVESPASRAQLDEGKSFRDVVCSIWKGCLWAWLARPQPSKSKSNGESERREATSNEQKLRVERNIRAPLREGVNYPRRRRKWIVAAGLWMRDSNYHGMLLAE